MGAVGGASVDAKADGTRGSTVVMYPVTPPQRHKPMMPAEQAGLAMDPTVVTVRGSLDPTTAPLQPGPVATAGGDGRDVAKAGAHENWVQRRPVTPPAAANASDSPEAGQPSDVIHYDDGERLAGSGLPRTRSGSDGCWRGRGCSGGRKTGDLGIEVPADPTAATHAGVSREAGRPGDGIHCDDGERLAGSGFPQTRSSGGRCWQGRGCSGGRSAGELGTEVPVEPTAATRAHGAIVPVLGE